MFQVLTEGELLILDRHGSSRYFQVYANGDGTFHAEVSANQFLPPEEQLGGAELAALGDLGWQVPKVGGSPNHHQRVGPAQAAESLAALALWTLERVIGVTAPAELRYQAFNKAGQEISLPALVALGVSKAQKAVGRPRCPACRSEQVSADGVTEAIVCQQVGQSPASLLPPLACRHCGLMSFTDGRYLARSGSRLSATAGMWQVVAIQAKDLEQAELGPDGWLCLALLSGDDERFLSVAPQHLPKMAGALAYALGETGSLGEAGASGDAAAILSLVRKAFAARFVTGRDSFDRFLHAVGIPFERYSWP